MNKNCEKCEGTGEIEMDDEACHGSTGIKPCECSINDEE